MLNIYSKKNKNIDWSLDIKRNDHWLVRVAVSVAVGLLHVHAELVLLVAAHVGVAHEVQGVVMNAHRRSDKVQFDLRTEETNTVSPLCWFEGLLLDFRISERRLSLTFAFCCRVSLLMEIRLLDLGSPITTHQPSSRFWNSKHSLSLHVR